jgi:hypothetical protein
VDRAGALRLAAGAARRLLIKRGPDIARVETGADGATNAVDDLVREDGFLCVRVLVVGDFLGLHLRTLPGGLRPRALMPRSARVDIPLTDRLVDSP